MLMFPNFLEFKLIEEFVVSIMQTNDVGSFTKVVTKVTVASASELGFLGFKVSGLIFAPLEASELSHFGLVEVKAGDVTHTNLEVDQENLVVQVTLEIKQVHLNPLFTTILEL